jgi:hypothetical protein
MTEKKILTAEEIFATKDHNTEDIDVSKWMGEGAYIRVRSLSAKEAFDFVELSKDEDKKQEAMIVLVCTSAVNEEGDRLFTDDQVEQLKEKSFGMFKEIQDHALALNGFKEEEIEAAKKELSETET